MKTILICPLDWGMGHATRVQQVAGYLKDKGHVIIIATSPRYLDLFDRSVYTIRLSFKSYRARYSSFLPQYICLLLQAPIMLLQYFVDRVRTAKLAKKYNVDIVISDNRFGARSRKARSIYITHQISIKANPFGINLGKILTSVHRKITERFDEIWVPDYLGFLSGDLSFSKGRIKNRYWIGALSMLNVHSNQKPEQLPEGKFTLVILSGPEPQRTILEKLLIKKLLKEEGSFIFAGGSISSELTFRKEDNLLIYNYLPPIALKYLIKESKAIICRAGYSTIMDLVSLGRNALLIPTPGQTEQEYLAEYLTKLGLFSTIKQSNISKTPFPPYPVPANMTNYLEKSNLAFKETIDGLFNRLSSQ